MVKISVLLIYSALRFSAVTINIPPDPDKTDNNVIPLRNVAHATVNPTGKTELKCDSPILFPSKESAGFFPIQKPAYPTLLFIVLLQFKVIIDLTIH